MLRLAPRKPLIANVIWALTSGGGIGPWQRWLLRSLMRRVDCLSVHSQACAEVCARIFPALVCRLMYFGVSTATFPLTQPSSRASLSSVVRILAAGNDGTRDWETLLAAFGNDDRFELTIVCWRVERDAVAHYSNVRLVDRPSTQEFRDLYSRADVVAVPMKENIFSGITVALEAVAGGKPLLVSRTGGVPTYLAEDEAIYCPVGDAAAMKAALLCKTFDDRRKRARRAQACFVAADYSTLGLMKRYDAFTQTLLDASPHCEQARA